MTLLSKTTLCFVFLKFTLIVNLLGNLSPEEEFIAIDNIYHQNRSKLLDQNKISDILILDKNTAKKIWRIVQKDPSNKNNIRLLNWLTTYPVDSIEAFWSLSLLEKHFYNSPDISNICLNVPNVTNGNPETFLEKVLNYNANLEVRASACVALYQLSLMTGSNSTKHLNRLSTEFQHVYDPIRGSTYGQFAKREITHNTIFGIGCKAPNITGIDFKGNKFELRDFKGKVVVLTFWGFW